MKNIETFEVLAILCPAINEIRPATACIDCDAYKGDVPGEWGDPHSRSVSHIKCSSDES